MNEDINQNLKKIFCLFDEYCKQNGIFYDIVDDEASRQGYVVKGDQEKTLYDYIKPQADRLNLILDVDKKRKDGALYKFTVGAITDYWEKWSPKKGRMTIFAYKKDADAVKGGKTIYQSLSAVRELTEMQQSYIEKSAHHEAPPGANRVSDYSYAEKDGSKGPIKPYPERKNAFDIPRIPPYIKKNDSNTDSNWRRRHPDFEVGTGHPDDDWERPIGIPGTQVLHQVVPDATQTSESPVVGGEPTSIDVVPDDTASREADHSGPPMVIPADAVSKEAGDPAVAIQNKGGFPASGGVGVMGIRQPWGAGNTEPGRNMVVPKSKIGAFGGEFGSATGITPVRIPSLKPKFKKL